MAAVQHQSDEEKTSARSRSVFCWQIHHLLELFVICLTIIYRWSIKKSIYKLDMI